MGTMQDINNGASDGSSEQSHTFLFFSCETLSPNPKLYQILSPDFFLLEQRIVSTGEKFYSKYLFESQIMIYIT